MREASYKQEIRICQYDPHIHVRGFANKIIYLNSFDFDTELRNRQ